MKQIQPLISLISLSIETLRECKASLTIHQQIEMMSIANKIKRMFEDDTASTHLQEE